MENIRDMSSKINSLEGVKEKYKNSVIENYKNIREKKMQIEENAEYDNQLLMLRREFNYYHCDECYDNSLGSNSRWSIISKKNLFGLQAKFLPKENMEPGELFLKGCSGRFQVDKFNSEIFPNYINITDVLERSQEEQYKEIEEFYNMTNKEFFERYGVNAYHQDHKNLVANCVIIDSLLKGKYSEIKDIFCGQSLNNVIEIKLLDGTKIKAVDMDRMQSSGITIEKDNKNAKLNFKAVSLGKSKSMLNSINDLEVEDVTYTGNEELIEELKQAMQEQFKSQEQFLEEESKDNSIKDMHEEKSEKDALEEISKRFLEIEKMQENLSEKIEELKQVMQEHFKSQEQKDNSIKDLHEKKSEKDALEEMAKKYSEVEKMIENKEETIGEK